MDETIRELDIVQNKLGKALLGLPPLYRKPSSGRGARVETFPPQGGPI